MANLRFTEILKDVWDISFWATNILQLSYTSQFKLEWSFLASILNFITCYPISHLWSRSPAKCRRSLVDMMISIATGRDVAYGYPYAILSHQWAHCGHKNQICLQPHFSVRYSCPIFFGTLFFIIRNKNLAVILFHQYDKNQFFLDLVDYYRRMVILMAIK